MRRLSFPILCLLAALTASPTFAQGGDSLDRAESLVEAGDYAGARAALERWAQATDDGHASPSGERARALLLRARLATDATAAEKDYLTVALGYPTSPHAPLALLSLGQGILASGDIDRAILYLQRLVRDYPRSPHQPAGTVWLARAYRLDGNRAAACDASRHALRNAADAEVIALLRHEESAACPEAAGTADARAEVEAGPGAAGRAGPSTVEAAVHGRFAVQSGAFRQAGGADALARRLREAGYDARVVRVPGSGLLRVRAGRFPESADAQALARRIGAAGFPAVVVGDADKELPRP